MAEAFDVNAAIEGGIVTLAQLEQHTDEIVTGVSESRRPVAVSLHGKIAGMILPLALPNVVDTLRQDPEIIDSQEEAELALDEGRTISTSELISAEPGEPAVIPPNSPPTGSRFATSTDSYVAGGMDVPQPEWLKADAERMAREREEQQ